MMKVWTQTLVTDMNQVKTEKVTGRIETEYPKAPESDKTVLHRYLSSKKVSYLVKSWIKLMEKL